MRKGKIARLPVRIIGDVVSVIENRGPKIMYIIRHFGEVIVGVSRALLPQSVYSIQDTALTELARTAIRVRA